MSARSNARWRSVAKWLRIIGGVSCVGLFLSYLALVEGRGVLTLRRPEGATASKRLHDWTDLDTPGAIRHSAGRESFAVPL
jgi:hypothetical protein